MHDDEDQVKVTLAIPREIWDLLQEVTEPGQDWHDVAARALEAGLEQASAPTNASGRPRGWKGA